MAISRRRLMQSLVAIPAAQLAAAVFGKMLPTAKWWVDSVNGSDSNTGLSASQAFATIAKVVTVRTAGDSIALACGSYWREQLSSAADNETVIGYGTGASPILDCADVISSGAWSKTGGQVSVYQASVPIAGNGSTWVSVWEDFSTLGGVTGRLVRASSIANCDATAGSYYPSSDSTSPITLYIHTSDGSNPSSNGKTYEYSARQCGYDGYSNVGCVVNGITAQRNLANDGSIRVGANGTAVNCTALYGSKHNFLGRAGSSFYGCTAQDAYFGGQSLILFVYNENTPAGQPVTFSRCSANLTVYDANSSGFYGHVNTSGAFGLLTFDTCTTNRCSFGFSGNSAARAVVANCTASNCNVGCLADHDWVISGFSGSANQGANTQLIQVGGIANVEIIGLTGSSLGYWIWIMNNASNCYIHDCDWTSAGNVILLDWRGANGSVIVRRVTFKSPALGYVIPGSPGVGFLLDSDYNVFTGFGSSGPVAQPGAGNPYLTYSQWVALGYDAHSVAN